MSPRTRLGRFLLGHTGIVVALALCPPAVRADTLVGRTFQSLTLNTPTGSTLQVESTGTGSAVYTIGSEGSATILTRSDGTLEVTASTLPASLIMADGNRLVIGGTSGGGTISVGSGTISTGGGTITAGGGTVVTGGGTTSSGGGIVIPGSGTTASGGGTIASGGGLVVVGGTPAITAIPSDGRLVTSGRLELDGTLAVPRIVVGGTTTATVVTIPRFTSVLQLVRVGPNGTLQVSDVLQVPTVEIVDGARLAGAGRIVGDVVSSGTVAPGNSIGTLTVEGDGVFAPTSVFQAEINGNGSADKLVVTGTQTLGGTLEIVPETGAAYAVGTRYTLIEANRVTGAFSALRVTDPAGLLRGLVVRPSVTADGVYATLGTPFATDAGTAQTAAVARTLDATYVSGLVTLVTALDGLSAADRRQALNSLQPARHAAAATVATDVRRLATGAVGERLAARRAEVEPAIAARPAQLAMAPSGEATLADGRLSAQAPLVATVEPATGVWAQVLGGTWRQGGGDGRDGYRSRAWGFVGGYDRKLDADVLGGRLTVGGFLGVVRTRIRHDSPAFGLAGGEDEANQGLAGLYAGWAEDGGWFADLTATGSRQWTDGTRTAALGPAATQRLSYDRGGRAFGFALTGGRSLSFGAVSVTPSSTLSWQRQADRAFTETGGSAALSVDGSARTSTAAEAGVRFAWTVLEEPDRRIAPTARIAVSRGFGDRGADVTARFAAGGGAFTVDGGETGATTVRAGIGLEAAFAPNVAITADLGTERSDDRRGILGLLRVRYGW